MTEQPKEGVGRPLYESAPKLPPEVPAAPWLWAAAGSYLLAWLYTKKLILVNLFDGIWPLLFAVLFVAGVDAMARALHRPAARETPLWAGCWLALSCAMPLWGRQVVLEGWQLLAWHLLAIWFVLARCGMLAQGYTGSLCFLDALSGTLLLPFGNFFRRIQVLYAGLQGLGRHRLRLRQAAKLLLTVVITMLLCAMAGGLLCAADANFAALGRRIGRWAALLLDAHSFGENLLVFLLSLPVGAWLYGLVAGALRRSEPPCGAARFFALLEPVRMLPAMTANVAVGALCLLYGVFFALQLLEWLAAAPLGLTAPQASTFAVEGFWELLRILLLNFCVLAVIRFLGRHPLPRALAALFCAFGIGFAALAGAKLVVYIQMYAFTPRRVVAGWFLCVLAVWAVLLLVRVFRGIPAARMGLAVLAVSFVVLSCLDLQGRIVQANIARYRVGIDQELDLDVLQDCGLNPWYGYGQQPWYDGDARAVQYTRWLLDAGWFQTHTVKDIERLYDIPGEDAGREQQVALGEQYRLRLTFDEAGRCLAAALTPTENGV